MFTQGKGCFVSLGRQGEGRTLPGFAFPQLLSDQNNPYTKVAYLGVTYSDLFQWLTVSIVILLPTGICVHMSF